MKGVSESLAAWDSMLFVGWATASVQSNLNGWLDPNRCLGELFDGLWKANIRRTKNEQKAAGGRGAMFFL
jgi:hypothetical protein